MVISNCLSLNLSDILVHSLGCAESTSTESLQCSLPNKDIARKKARQEWQTAIASLETLLLSVFDTSKSSESAPQGLILSSPTQVINNSKLNCYLKNGIFKVNTSATMALMPGNKLLVEKEYNLSSIMELPLPIKDPLREEQFCLIFTSEFALILVLGKDEKGDPKFHFSFDPETIEKCWLLLKSRLLITHHHQLNYLEELISNFSNINPDYRIVCQFTRLLLNNLPQRNYENKNNSQVKINKNEFEIPHKSNSISLKKTPLPPYPEVELLQALTHEIRTPLTTIRTITKLLLKRAKLTPDLVKHLESIDQECTEQINRMELIFRAAELETKPTKEKPVNLVPISLTQIFTKSIPCWKKQAQRRNINLDIILPQKLPYVISDPAMLTQILTGLIEKFTRNIPSGGEIQVLISTAGNQLKLQFLPKSNYLKMSVKSLGQFLLFQPDTGCLSLNLDVTKNIFHALGGKLIVRQKQDQGEVLTVFLPLGNSSKNMVKKKDVSPTNKETVKMV